MSCRRLISLVEGLPSGARALGGGGWLNEHELLALLVEATVNRGVKKSKQVRIPRPELERPKKPIKQRFREVARMMKGGADG